MEEFEKNAAVSQYTVAIFVDPTDPTGSKATWAEENALVLAIKTARDDARAKAKAEGKTDAQADDEATAATNAKYAELNVPLSYFNLIRRDRASGLFNSNKEKINRFLRLVNWREKVHCDIKGYRVLIREFEEVPKDVIKGGGGAERCPASL